MVSMMIYLKMSIIVTNPSLFYIKKVDCRGKGKGEAATASADLPCDLIQHSRAF